MAQKYNLTDIKKNSGIEEQYLAYKKLSYRWQTARRV